MLRSLSCFFNAEIIIQIKYIFKCKSSKHDLFLTSQKTGYNYDLTSNVHDRSDPQGKRENISGHSQKILQDVGFFLTQPYKSPQVLILAMKTGVTISLNLNFDVNSLQFPNKHDTRVIVKVRLAEFVLGLLFDLRAL